MQLPTHSKYLDYHSILLCAKLCEQLYFFNFLEIGFSGSLNEPEIKFFERQDPESTPIHNKKFTWKKFPRIIVLKAHDCKTYELSIRMEFGIYYLCKYFTIFVEKKKCIKREEVSRKKSRKDKNWTREKKLVRRVEGKRRDSW